MTATATTPTMQAGEVLAAAREERRTADAAEARLLQLAVEWAIIHPAESLSGAATMSWLGGGDTDLTIAGEGAPTVSEFCLAEFATAVGMSDEAGRRYLGEAVELRYRLPRTYHRVVDGDLQAWKARSIARQTMGLTLDAAGFVDAQVAPVAHKIGPISLERLVEEAIGRFMPEEVQRRAEAAAENRHVTFHPRSAESFSGTMEMTAGLDLLDALDLQAAIQAGAAQRKALGSTDSLDVRRSQALGDLARHQPALDLDLTTTNTNPDNDTKTGADPEAEPVAVPRVPARQVVLYVHLTEAALAGHDPVARLENDNRVITVDQIRTWCGRPDTGRIVVKPVLDLAACDDVDSDTVPARHAEQIAVRDHTCVFPWCTRPARTSHPDGHGCDADHIQPRARGGPTCPCNLAPLCRRHHRLKTHGGWTYQALDPGTYAWTSHHGYRYRRDHTGTTPEPSG